MHCTPCRKKAIDRDGGENGLCTQHRKQRCQICHERSSGEELCIDCVYRVQAQRQDAVANFRIDSEHEAYRADMGEEALRQARSQMYAAVDSMFRIIGFTVQQLAQSLIDKERQAVVNQMEFTFEVEHVA